MFFLLADLVGEGEEGEILILYCWIEEMVNLGS
jgi:hypothetical protein